MRRSLLARLLAVSFTVAVCAIASTGWLTYRATNGHLNDELERVLETDASIYEQLATFALEHRSWDDVGPLVSDLSGQTGRRIALTQPDGSLITDSLDGRRGQVAALPPDPAALIDVASQPPDEEAASTELAPLPADSPLEVSEHERVRNAAFVDAFTACLTQHGVGHRTHDVGGGLRTVELTDPAAGAPENCATDAHLRARHETTAGPALLYLGTGGTPQDPLTAAGPGRTILTTLVVAAATLGVTWIAARRLLRPVDSLTAAAKRMEAGDTTTRVDPDGPEELAALGRAFNSMADTAQRNERARRALVSDVAHELRNPLANMRSHLEAVHDGVLPFDHAVVESLLEEAALLERLTSDLSDLAQADAGGLSLHPRSVNLDDIATQIVNAASQRAHGSDISLTLDARTRVPVSADPARLRQAIGNIVDNALRYTPPGGKIHIAVIADVDVARLTVADTGIGVDSEDLCHLFDRFYRADPSRSRRTGGSGLGLAIARHLVEAHGGTIRATSEIGHGSTFTIQLPLESLAVGRSQTPGTRSAAGPRPVVK